MTLKAIETKYKGYRFRSRLEARWAVAFDAVGIAWEYETEGFDLPSGYYLPDFWLPQWKVYAEVKPTTPTAKEAVKMVELAFYGETSVISLVSLPSESFWTTVFCQKEKEFEGKSLIGVCFETVSHKWLRDRDRYRHSWCWWSGYCSTNDACGNTWQVKSDKLDSATLQKCVTLMMENHSWCSDKACDKCSYPREAGNVREFYNTIINAARSARFEHGERPR